MPKQSKVRNTQGFTFRHSPPRAVLWGAVSSGSQAADDKDSLENQFRVLKDYAQSQSFQVIDSIEIPGFSRDFYNYRDFCEAAAEEGILAPTRMFQHWKDRTFDVLCVLNMTRLGREEGIIHDFVGQTYGIGAFVYTTKNGLIAPENRRVVTMIEAYGSKSEVDEIQRRHDHGMRSRVKLGLHTGNRVPYFHRYTFDSAGKPVQTPGLDGQLYYLTIDRSHQRVLDDLYDLVVNEQTPYDDLESAMYQRGHGGKDGQPQPRRAYSIRFWQPPFHGHIGYSFPKVRQPWLIDPAYAADLPESVTLAYNVCEAAYPPDKLAVFRNEIIERTHSQGGRSGPQMVHAFSRLTVCAECRHNLTYYNSNPRYPGYYRCTSAYRINAAYPCKSRKIVREDKLIAFVQPRIDAFFASPNPGAFRLAGEPVQSMPPTDLHAQLEQVNAEIDTVNQRIKDPRLPEAALPDFYTMLDELTASRAKLQGSLTVQNTRIESEHERTLLLVDNAYREDLAHIWQHPPAKTQRLLLRLFGHARLLVSEGVPVGFV